jgi:hypothetical protein
LERHAHPQDIPKNQMKAETRWLNSDRDRLAVCFFLVRLDFARPARWQMLQSVMVMGTGMSYWTKSKGQIIYFLNEPFYRRTNAV